jgi:hypothetical protein
MGAGLRTMKSPARARPRERGPFTLVSLNRRETLLVRWVGNTPFVERPESSVPDHRRVRHGGAGPGSADARRLDHLARYLADVADATGVDPRRPGLGHGTPEHA